MVCAVPFGVGGSCLVQASMAGVGRGRSQAVRALRLVGWGWSGVVCTAACGVGGLRLVHEHLGLVGWGW